MKETNQENKNNTGICNGCTNCGAGCTCGRMHGYGGHPILRVVLALVILVFVFIGGIKLGELRAELGMSYDHHPMMYGQYGGYGGYGMMDSRTNVVPVILPATAAPAATTATPSAR